MLYAEYIISICFKKIFLDSAMTGNFIFWELFAYNQARSAGALIRYGVPTTAFAHAQYL
jgi:hypothetical protein